MEGMHFLNVAKRGGKFTVEAVGGILSQVGADHWLVQLQTNVGPIQRVTPTSGFRDAVLFNTSEELLAYAQVNFPKLFPPALKQVAAPIAEALALPKPVPDLTGSLPAAPVAADAAPASPEIPHTPDTSA
jgi:hypothetical protein